MNWQEALRRRALDNGTVAGIVGAAVEWGDRKALPALVLQVVSDPRPQYLSSAVLRRESRVQVDCWGESRAQVVALVEAAIAALVPAGTFNGASFGRAFVADPGPRSLNERTEAGLVHRDQFDLMVWHD